MKRFEFDQKFQNWLSYHDDVRVVFPLEVLAFQLAFLSWMLEQLYICLIQSSYQFARTYNSNSKWVLDGTNSPNGLKCTRPINVTSCSNSSSLLA
jgi:hypothetical protein